MGTWDLVVVVAMARADTRMGMASAVGRGKGRRIGRRFVAEVYCVIFEGFIASQGYNGFNLPDQLPYLPVQGPPLRQPKHTKRKNETRAHPRSSAPTKSQTPNQCRKKIKRRWKWPEPLGAASRCAGGLVVPVVLRGVLLGIGEGGLVKNQDGRVHVLLLPVLLGVGGAGNPGLLAAVGAAADFSVLVRQVLRCREMESALCLDKKAGLK